MTEDFSWRDDKDKPEWNLHDFLARCAEAGYTVVAIGRQTPLIPYSMSWPFKDQRGRPIVRDSVFAYPDGNVEGVKEPQINSWPAIWHIVGQYRGVSGGCGNQHQHQIHPDKLSGFGVYTLEPHGGWLQVE